MDARSIVQTAFLFGLLCFNLTAQESRPSLTSVLQSKEGVLYSEDVASVENGVLNIQLQIDRMQNADEVVKVSFIDPNGAQTQELTPEGKVAFKNVGEGLASLVIVGSKSTYAAKSFFVRTVESLPDPKVEDPNKVAVTDPNTFRVKPVSGVSYDQIKPEVLNSGTATKGPALKPLSYYKIETTSNYQVALLPDGRLRGMVVVPEEGYETKPGRFRIVILRNGIQIASTTSDDDGLFFVPGLKTGIHSIIASGPAGHAAFSFEIVEQVTSVPVARRAMRFSPDGTLPVTKVMQVPDTLVVLVVPPTLMPAVRDIVENAFPAPPVTMPIPEFPMGAGFPAPASGFGGGISGGGGLGGGGGGGLGGFGGVLGIGGLAAGIAAIAANNDGFNLPPATVIIP